MLHFLDSKHAQFGLKVLSIVITFLGASYVATTANQGPNNPTPDQNSSVSWLRRAPPEPRAPKVQVDQQDPSGQCLKGPLSLMPPTHSQPVRPSAEASFSPERAVGFSSQTERFKTALQPGALRRDS